MWKMTYVSGYQGYWQNTVMSSLVFGGLKEIVSAYVTFPTDYLTEVWYKKKRKKRVAVKVEVLRMLRQMAWPGLMLELGGAEV